RRRDPRRARGRGAARGSRAGRTGRSRARSGSRSRRAGRPARSGTWPRRPGRRPAGYAAPAGPAPAPRGRRARRRRCSSPPQYLAHRLVAEDRADRYHDEEQRLLHRQPAGQQDPDGLPGVVAPVVRRDRGHVPGAEDGDHRYQREQQPPPPAQYPDPQHRLQPQCTGQAAGQDRQVGQVPHGPLEAERLRAALHFGGPGTGQGNRRDTGQRVISGVEPPQRLFVVVPSVVQQGQDAREVLADVGRGDQLDGYPQHTVAAYREQGVVADQLVHPGDRHAELLGNVRHGHPLGRLDELAGDGDRFGHPTNLPWGGGWAPRHWRECRGQRTRGTRVRIVRWIGRELAGAWRSVRYDLTRGPNPAKQPTEVLYPEYDAYERQPRRWYAAAGLGLAVAAGVAATYVAVAGGIGAVFTPIVNAVPGLSEAAPARQPAAGTPPVGRQVSGRVPATHSASPAGRHAAGAPAPDAAAPAPVVQPTCVCPVPVPTPQTPGPTPSNSPSPTPTPSVSHS